MPWGFGPARIDQWMRRTEMHTACVLPTINVPELFLVHYCLVGEEGDDIWKIHHSPERFVRKLRRLTGCVMRST
jgi:hypothetical protein